MREARFRSIIKALTWRFIATTTTMALVYIATRDLEIMGIVGVADVSIKLFFYYMHERAWGRIPWGRNVHFGKK
jgi:adenylylsulfate kinase